MPSASVIPEAARKGESSEFRKKIGAGGGDSAGGTSAGARSLRGGTLRLRLQTPVYLTVPEGGREGREFDSD